MIRLLLFALLLGAFNLSLAQVYNVSNQSEFDSAVDNVLPGDSIKLSAGTWNDVTLDFNGAGTEANPIVLTAQSPGETVLTGTSSLTMSGSYLVVSNLDFNSGASSGDDIISFRKSSSEIATYSRLTNCRILDYNPTSEIDYKWVSIYGDHNRVDHCNFEGKNNEGALMVVWLDGEPNYNQIDHNYFGNIAPLGANGGETIRIGTSTNSMTESRTIVEYNVFEECDGEIEIISNKSGFNIYRYNTFLDNDGMLTLRHGNDCEVYGNFFFGEDKSSGGVRIIGERHKVYNNYFEGLRGDGFRSAISLMNGVVDSPLNRYFQVKDALIVHNTIVDCKEPLAIGEGANEELSLPPLDCIFANNVIDRTFGSASITMNDDPINFTYVANYINSKNSIVDDGIIAVDPQLEFDGALWRPSASSPLIDAAVGEYDFVSTDMDGHSRETLLDIGSDEVSSEAIVITPLTKDSVGFVWVKSVIVEVPLSAKDEIKKDIYVSYDAGIATLHGLESYHEQVDLKLYDLNGRRVVSSSQLIDGNYSFPISKGRIGVLVLSDQQGKVLKKIKVRIP